jgi:site-specific recombinase XerC
LPGRIRHLGLFEQHGDPEEVRAMLGHKRLETTQVYMRIRPRQLKQPVAFYDDQAQDTKLFASLPKP